MSKRYGRGQKRYRAVVIDGRVIVKRAAVIAAILVIAAIVIHSFWDDGGIARVCSKLLLGFDATVPEGAAAAEVMGAETVNNYGIFAVSEVPQVSPQTAQPTSEPQSTEGTESSESIESSEDAENITDSIKEINAAQNAGRDDYAIRLGNQTSYSPDIDAMLAEPLSFDMNGDGPKILIVHTHATEAYSPEGAQGYDRDESDRSLDTAENVVAVGDMLTDYFNSRGIETIHDRELHDHPSFNGSYADALASTEQNLANYPSIRIVFDVHRDSIVYDDGTMAKTVTEINGKKAAQLMFVVGTNEKGLYHPNWRENLKLALKLQNKIDEKYPSLMRYVNLRRERFNGHTTNGSLIIEVGTSGNSLEEAKYGMSLAAECIADYLSEL